jgi:restriction endonuclease Mrr
MHHLHHCRRPLDPQELCKRIADDLNLSAEQPRARRGSESAWHHRVRQAKQHLVDAGLVMEAQRGPWKLTEKGHKRMERREYVATEGLWDE